MATHAGTTGYGLYFGVVERTKHPGINGVTLTAIHGTDEDVIGRQTGSINPIVAILTTLRPYGTVVEYLGGGKSETNGCVATVARGGSLNMIQRFTDGKYTVMTLLTLCG